MLKNFRGLAPAAGVLAVVGLAAGIASSATLPTVNDSMTHVMAVQAQTIWDTSSKAFNAKGNGLVASKLTAQDWKNLGEAGRLMKERATYLATAKHLVVANHDEHILGEEAAHGGPHDAASVKQIQAWINAKPKLFSQHAWTLARNGEALEKAAKTRDIKVLYRVSAGLDDVCDGCHEPFWGTDMPPPVPKGYIPVLKGK
jgi:hypothetical protein